MQLKYQKTVEETVTITPPLYWKRDGNDYLGILNADQIVAFRRSDRFGFIMHCELWLKEDEIKKALNGEWESITEEEFLDAHSRILNSLSLEPQLTNVDDLKNVF